MPGATLLLCSSALRIRWSPWHRKYAALAAHRMLCSLARSLSCERINSSCRPSPSPRSSPGTRGSVKQYNSKRSRFSSLNQKALRRSHAFHGLQQRCGNSYTLPSTNVNTLPRGIVLYFPKALRPLRAPPIHCWLCRCRRIKQLMQYPPISSPPIKGFVQKAFLHTSSTVTHTSHIHSKV